MNPYHKIQTVYKRDPENRFKTLLDGQFSLPEFEYLAANEWVFTEKVDGTNVRVMWDGTSVRVGGKTDRAEMPRHLLEEMPLINAEMFEEAFEKVRDSAMEVCLYGEGFGPKIQKGGKYSDTHGFVLFDVKVGDWWLSRDDVHDVALKMMIPHVPIVGQGTLADMVDMARDGFRSQWGGFRAEGLVARPATELRTRSGERVITKVKCTDFLGSVR